MPLLSIYTNIAEAKIPDDFLTETSALIAKALGKPESYVLILVNPGQVMSFGGWQEPCAMMYLDSLGSVGGEQNKQLAQNVGSHMETCLGIKKDRFYIKISDLPRSDLGFNGTTFA